MVAAKMPPSLQRCYRRQSLGRFSVLRVKSVPQFRSLARPNCLILVFVITQPDDLAVDGDLGPPPGLPRRPMHPANSARIVTLEANIPLVALICSIPKVGKAIVVAVAVYVVDLSTGLPARPEREGDPMRLVDASRHVPDLVALGVNRSEGEVPGIPCIPSAARFARISAFGEHLRVSRLPSEIPGFRIVSQQANQMINRGKSFCGHATKLPRSGAASYRRHPS
jgi:hypothetical protein